MAVPESFLRPEDFIPTLKGRWCKRQVVILPNVAIQYCLKILWELFRIQNIPACHAPLLALPPTSKKQARMHADTEAMKASIVLWFSRGNHTTHIPLVPAGTGHIMSTPAKQKQATVLQKETRLAYPMPRGIVWNRPTTNIPLSNLSSERHLSNLSSLPPLLFIHSQRLTPRSHWQSSSHALHTIRQR